MTSKNANNVQGINDMYKKLCNNIENLDDCEHQGGDIVVYAYNGKAKNNMSRKKV